MTNKWIIILNRQSPTQKARNTTSMPLMKDLFFILMHRFVNKNNNCLSSNSFSRHTTDGSKKIEHVAIKKYTYTRTGLIYFWTSSWINHLSCNSRLRLQLNVYIELLEHLLVLKTKNNVSSSNIYYFKNLRQISIDNRCNYLLHWSDNIK